MCSACGLHLYSWGFQSGSACHPQWAHLPRQLIIKIQPQVKIWGSPPRRFCTLTGTLPSHLLKLLWTCGNKKSKHKIQLFHTRCPDSCMWCQSLFPAMLNCGHSPPCEVTSRVSHLCNRQSTFHVWSIFHSRVWIIMFSLRLWVTRWPFTLPRQGTGLMLRPFC